MDLPSLPPSLAPSPPPSLPPSFLEAQAISRGGDTGKGASAADAFDAHAACGAPADGLLASPRIIGGGEGKSTGSERPLAERDRSAQRAVTP